MNRHLWSPPPSSPLCQQPYDKSDAAIVVRPRDNDEDDDRLLASPSAPRNDCRLLDQPPGGMGTTGSGKVQRGSVRSSTRNSSSCSTAASPLQPEVAVQPAIESGGHQYASDNNSTGTRDIVSDQHNLESTIGPSNSSGSRWKEALLFRGLRSCSRRQPLLPPQGDADDDDNDDDEAEDDDDAKRKTIGGQNVRSSALRSRGRERHQVQQKQKHEIPVGRRREALIELEEGSRISGRGGGGCGGVVGGSRIGARRDGDVRLGSGRQSSELCRRSRSERLKGRDGELWEEVDDDDDDTLEDDDDDDDKSVNSLGSDESVGDDDDDRRMHIGEDDRSTSDEEYEDDEAERLIAPAPHHEGRIDDTPMHDRRRRDDDTSLSRIGRGLCRGSNRQQEGVQSSVGGQDADVIVDVEPTAAPRRLRPRRRAAAIHGRSKIHEHGPLCRPDNTAEHKDAPAYIHRRGGGDRIEQQSNVDAKCHHRQHQQGENGQQQKGGAVGATGASPSGLSTAASPLAASISDETSPSPPAANPPADVFVGPAVPPPLAYRRLYDPQGPVVFAAPPLQGACTARSELRLWATDEDRTISQNSSKRKVHRALWMSPVDTSASIPVAMKFVDDVNSRDGRSVKREIECHIFIYQRLAQLMQEDGYSKIQDAWPCAELFGYHLDKKTPGNCVLITRKLSGPDFFDVIRSEHNGAYGKSPAAYECHKLQWCLLALKRIAQYARIGVRHNDIKPDNIVLDYHCVPETNERMLDVKIIDLGTASMHYAKDFTGGTTWYESPEQKMLEYHTKKNRDPEAASRVEIDLPSDAWGAGLSITEVLMGRRVVDLLKSPNGPGPLEYCGAEEGWAVHPVHWIECARRALGLHKENQRFPFCAEAAKYVFDNLVLTDPQDRARVEDVIAGVEEYVRQACDQYRRKHAQQRSHDPRGSHRKSK